MKKENEKIKYCKLFFWSLQYLKKYVVFFVLAILFRILFEAVSVMVLMLLQTFIDALGDETTEKILGKMPCYLAILVIVMIAAYILLKTFEMIYAEWGTKEVQLAVYNKTRDMGMHYINEVSIGEVLSLLSNNVISFYFLFSECLPKFVTVIISSLLAVIMLCIHQSFCLAGIVIASFFCVVFCNVWLRERIEKNGHENADATMEFNRNAYDIIEAAEEVRIFKAQDWSKKRLNQALEKSIDTNIKRFLLSSEKTSVFYICKMIAFFVYVYLCLLETRKGSQCLGKCIADFLYVNMAFSAIGNLDQVIVNQDKHIYNIQKVYDFMQQLKEERVTGTTRQIERGDIVFHNVTFAYKGKPVVLSQLDFTIKHGEKVALVGGSGEGKSTILKLLTGSYQVDSGEILIDGRQINEYDAKFLHQNMSIALQESYLFAMSIYENIQFGNLDAKEDEIYKAAQLAQADEFITKLPEGYHTVLNNHGDNLSGGERQRIILARCLLRNSKILLLDEITSSLDFLVEKRIIASLMNQNQTVLFCAHRLSVIKKADRVLVLDNGKIVEDGTYDELIRKNGYLGKLVSKGIVEND
ncbi:ABC transporter ATP-binding protein [[Clostridium] polysaccharolyticum]|uniref:ATP-binding cassette, subfamily B, MsbA n=1 Tax=[Clostridium] polysaccharolyticum TaxID=29364 RepID=A0A1I0C4J8_9FIRM|nr:ABC transporter ATP-binding protein [[Clostridium] polysaccharolyticum]SET14358.1 ATP-binding cassette, subfamily B, MsbA [[Clostridium] polysaccharolyticum]